MARPLRSIEAEPCRATPAQAPTASPGAPGRAPRRRLGWLIPLGLIAGTAAYYRLRPQPRGIDVAPRTYRVPADAVELLYNMVWYEDGERRFVHQIVERLCGIIRDARRWVVMDVFLFNLHHADRDCFVPLTRRVVEAFRGKDHPSFVIVDPFNTFYGTSPCPPLDWLREAGVQVGVVDTRRLRDNNMVYSPIWRLALQWFGNGRPRLLRNPVDPQYRISVRALLEALNFKGNHRKVLIADDGDSYVTLITTGNLEDSGCYYGEAALVVRSRAVARHLLASERAIGRISGLDIPCEVEDGPEPQGEVAITPLVGTAIKHAVLRDIRAAAPGAEIFVFMLFLADRDVMGVLKRAARRGLRITLVLDQSRISFGSTKGGYPNHFTAAELAREPNVAIRWGHTRFEEFHTKLMLIWGEAGCQLHVGSANYTRRGLSGTVLEANLRVEAPLDAPVARQAIDYARWVASPPRTLDEIPLERSRWKRLWYHIQERTGLATF